MLNNLNSLYGLIGFIFVFIIISTLFVYILTRKYNDKLHNLYSLFLNVSKKDLVMETIILLNFAVIFYYSIFGNNYGYIPIYLLIFLTIISSFLAFNVRIIITNVVYCAVSCGLLWLLDILNRYLEYVLYDKNIVIVKILFIVLIIEFAILTLVRQTQLLIENGRRKTW